MQFGITDTCEITVIDMNNHDKVVLEGTIPTNNVNPYVPCVEIKHGLKVEVRDYFLEQLRNNSTLTERFTLNTKRLNRWWYSVYFKDKSILD